MAAQKEQKEQTQEIDTPVSPADMQKLWCPDRGTSWLFSVAPGWILGGTISDVHEDRLVVKDSVWLQTVASGSSCFDATLGKVGTAWPVSDGFTIFRAAILMVVPSKSFRTHARQRETGAVKNAK